MAKAGEKRMAICPHHSGLDERIKNNTEAIVVHDEILRKLQNRPPAWVTIIIGLLTFALGWSVKSRPAETRYIEMPTGKPATVNREL